MSDRRCGEGHGRRRPWAWRLLAAAMVSLLLATGGSAATASEEPTVLRVAHAANPFGPLDILTFAGSQSVEDMIYEPLVAYGEGGELEPALATSWEVSDDGLRVTFHLREGVTFHDGTAFDADAVKWNFDRWVGNEMYSFFRTSQVIAEVNVLDSATVELVLSEPYPPLLRELTVTRPVRFLSPSAVGEDGAFVEAVGTGPWVVRSFSETGATLVRFDDYWGALPDIDQVEFKVIADPQTRISALRSGEVDIIGGTYMAPISPVEARDLQSAGGVELLVGEPDATFMLGLNTDGPLGEQAVRVAVAQAVNRDGLTEVIYAGFGEPAERVFPPSIPYAGEPNVRGFDPDAARATLEEAGWVASGDGRARDGATLQLDLLVPATERVGIPDPRTTAAAVAADLQAVGIGVNIVAVDAAAYIDRRAEGGYDLTFLKTFGEPYDPSSTSVSFFTSGGGYASVYSTPELDALVDAAIFATAEDERASAYQRMFDEVADVAAFVPISHPPNLWAVGPAVSGFEVPVTEVDLDLDGVTVNR